MSCPICGGKVERQPMFDGFCTKKDCMEATCTKCGAGWLEDPINEGDSTKYELDGGDYHG